MRNMDELGYVALPSKDIVSPGVLVIHEWWGLDAQTRSIADRFAKLGYLTLAPDLYHGELAKLGDNSEAAAIMKRHADQSPARLQFAFDTMLADPRCNGRIASVGFCFGGRMSLMLGLNRPVSAICTFYGGGMQQIFDRLEAIKAPVLGLFGDADLSIPRETIEAFDLLLDKIGVEHEVVVYPDSGHAFFRDSDPTVYKPAAAQDAWGRVTGFFGRHLGMPRVE